MEADFCIEALEEAMAQVRPPDDRRPSARYMTLESVGQLSDDPLISLLAVAR